ncbi:MAG: hypothetical protein JW797_13130 [Bradymonadales bacterium]|nr:hypothetical protein [Bradymonadales bacterium]
MKTSFGVTLILCFLGLGCPGRMDTDAMFAENPTNPLAFSAVDVYGRPLSVGVPSDYVWVMVFSAEDTSDAMQPITAEIAVEFHDQPGLAFLTIVDLRSLAFYKRPFAAGAIRDAGDRTVRRINRQLERRGLPPIENLHDHLFLITDNNGEITQRYGVRDPNRFLTVVLFDHHGMELGRYDPQDDLPAIFDGIRRGLTILSTRNSMVGTAQ